jgi:hypothetical protein
MSIIAVNFTKVSAERRAARATGYKVRNETNIIDVKPVTLGKQQTIVFVWKNTITYEPGVGSIEMQGDVIMLATEQEAKEAAELFTKSKRVPPKFSEAVYNTVLAKVTVQSLIMSRDIGLPPPVALPKVRAAAPAAAAKPADSKPAPKKK